jgi:uncharacterized protein (DUF1330 family)
MTEPVYALAQIDVKNQQDYIEKYGLPVFEQLRAAGGEVLVATDEIQVLEGQGHGNWMVLIRFPSAAAADNWYQSEEYAPLKQARIERLSNSGNVLMARGFDPSLLG